VTPASSLRAVVLALAGLALAAAASAALEPLEPAREGRALLELESPLGPVDYRAGRGLRVGDTGFVIGGFATVEADRLEHGGSHGGVEGLNFFLFYDPAPFVRLFSEVSLRDLGDAESGREGVRSAPRVDLDRLYADLGSSDQARLRVGQFLTPFGLWSPVQADPLVWTTSEPLIIEGVFDDTTTGAMLHGAAFRDRGALSFGVYGTFLDEVTAPADAPPAHYTAGARLEWASLAGWSLGTSYVAAERRRGTWNHLGGVDAMWRPREGIELTAEALFGKGARAARQEWGLYVQGVVETVRTVYAVARYERFDPPDRTDALDLFDVGVAWVPIYCLRLKVDYRFARQTENLSAAGLRASFSVLF